MQCGIKLLVKDNHRRIRTVGGIPVQRRPALSERRPALPAKQSSRPAAGSARARRGQGILGASAWEHALRPHGLGDPAHPEQIRQGRLCDALGRVADERKELPRWQVCAGGAQDEKPGLQRPALHGQRRRGKQESLWPRPRLEQLLRSGARRSHHDLRHERQRNLSRRSRTGSGRRATTAPSSSSSIRA